MNEHITREPAQRYAASCAGICRTGFVVAICILLLSVRIGDEPLWRYFLLLIAISAFYYLIFYPSSLIISALVFRRTGKWSLGFWEAVADALPGLLMALPYALAELNLNHVYRYKGVGNAMSEPMFLGLAFVFLFGIRTYIELRWPSLRWTPAVALLILGCLLVIPIFFLVPDIPE